MAAARLVMADWGEKLAKILEKEDIKILLKALYVDDIRTLTTALKKGKRWNEREKKFEFREDWRQEDEIAGESTTKRMAREIKKVMDSIYPNLSFEMETAEDFRNERLPTLDFSMWLDQCENGMQSIKYTFYEKEINTKFCIMEKSAVAEKSKISSLTQEVIRRMVNTCGDMEQGERNAILESFIEKLKVSGYKKAQIKEIITCGLKGYQTKIERADREGRALHRGAAQTIGKRQKKKLLEKTQWYRRKRTEEDEAEAEMTKEKTRRTDWNKKKTEKKMEKIEKMEKMEIKSVLFVPRTRNGELAKRLRQEEEQLSRMTGYKVKIVERGGMQVKNILHKSNPWEGQLCGRGGCLVCAQGGEGGGQCSKRNILYKTTCLACKEKGKDVNYYGESARTAYERGKEHHNDYQALSDDSHMAKHHVIEHPDKEGKLKFAMKVLKCYRTAFARQVHEAVVIQLNEKNGIMNSKGEFNRCKLPRLSVMMGRKEILEKIETQEQMSELEVESEIGKWRTKKRERDRKSKEEVSEKEPPRKKRRRIKIISRKRKNPEEEEAIENFNKITRYDNSLFSSRGDKPGPDIETNVKEGHLPIFEFAVNQNKCNKISNPISVFENLSQKRKIPPNLEESDSKTDIQTSPKEPKMLFPVFTVGCGKYSEGEKSKTKANPTLSYHHHPHPHRSVAKPGTSSTKQRKLKPPNFNYKPITSHFKPHPKITAGHTQN